MTNSVIAVAINQRKFGMDAALLKKTSIGGLAVCGLLLALGGCAGEPVRTDLPANHPANPAAESAVFVPPANPFALKAFNVEPARPTAGTGDHPKDQKQAEHGHEMPTMMPHSAAPMGSKEKSTEHRH
jgi:hypothetical protein